MENEVSSNNLDLQFHFIYKDDIKDVSEELLYSYESCKQYFETESIQWIKENDCLLLELGQLTKRNIFIVERFEGNVFDYLSKSKALILGPKCLISCITDDKTIPLTNTAVFNTAMMDMFVCTSGLNTTEKEKIKKLVNWMGGHYSEILYKGCTHLVSNTVKSAKYEKAALSSIKIMHPDWVKDVWTRCLDKYILASNKEFDKHQLPIFYALNITTTGFPMKIRTEINKLVTENGGKIIAAFKSDQTDILILEKTTKDSRKYQAAVKFKKECLNPQWIYDSVKHGFAQPVEKYTVKIINSSTPTKVGLSLDFNPDCTALSEISYVNQQKETTINETCSSTTSSGIVSLYRNKRAPERKYKEIIDNLSLKEIRKSESFLDGCSIYLCGFIPSEKEKLHKILNLGCATRYDELNEKVTHIIIGEPTETDIKSIKNYNYSPMFVTLEWLLECIKEKQPVEENMFLYKSSGLKSPNEPLLASPATERNIDSMNKCFKRPPIPKFKLDEILNKEKESEEKANDLLAQYLQPNKQDEENNLSETSNVNDAELSNYSNECTENVVCFLKDMTVYVHSTFNEDTFKDVVTDCKAAGAEIVDENYKSMVDYIIVPITGVPTLDMPMEAKKIVNDLWLDDSIEKEEIVDLQYFHKPIVHKDLDNPLNEMMIVLSTYPTSERDYLVTLSKTMGAIIDNVYERKKKPLLICPLPEGAKYEAALKWGYPVVTCKWLLECYRLKKRLPLKSFLLGDSLAPEDDIVLEKSLTEDTAVECLLNKSEASDIENHQPEINDENAEELSSSKWREYVNDLCDKDEILSQKFKDNIEKRHRRLSELIDNKGTPKNSQFGSPISSPIITPTSSTHNISDLVKEFPTPQREYLYKALNVMNNDDSPQTKRLKKLIATPGVMCENSPKTPVIPQGLHLPKNSSEKRQQRCKRKIDAMSSLQLPVQKKAKAPDTPTYKEIRENFWQEYFANNKDGAGNIINKDASTSTQFITVDKIANLCKVGSSDNKDNDDDNDNIEKTGRVIAESVSLCSNNSKSLNEDNVSDEEINRKINNSKKFQRLSDFINKKDEQTSRKSEQVIADTDTPYECPESEPHIPADNPIIDYYDPSEFNMRRNKINFSGIPKFSISCSKDSLRQEIIEAIKKLNGEVCDDLTKFDKNCTHLLCEKPNRGEKTLTSIASGKWILCLKYIEDSLAADYFLNEEYYEWGNPKAINNLPKLNSNDESIAKAAHRWRLQVISEQCGTFKGFRVLLHTTNNKVFRRLISAGSGHVIDVETPYASSDDAMMATHCFVEQNKLPLNKKDHKILAEAGVQILSMSYLNAYLTSEKKPDAANYKVNY